MTVPLVIATLWLALALGCYLVLRFQSGRPVNDTDRWCSRMDDGLRRQDGVGPRWVR